MDSMTIEEAEPLSSDDESLKRRITIEHVIEKCGSFSYFQMFHGFFLMLFPIASGVYNFYFVFASAEPKYSCVLPNKFDFEADSDECTYHELSGWNERVKNYTCTDWIYESHPFGKTFTQEANLICGQNIQRSHLSTALQLGAMLIFFTGQITDFIGRRRSMFLIMTILVLNGLITQSLIHFVSMDIKYKFLLLIINQFFSGIDGFMISLLLMIEITTSAYAPLVGNAALVGYALGEFVIIIMAYFSQHWLTLKWVMIVYLLALIPYLFFMPESPQWLLCKNRYDDLERVLHRMANFNGRSSSDWLPYYRHVIEKHRHERSHQKNNTVRLTLFDKIYRFVTHASLMRKLFIAGFLGFITLLLYFKCAFGLGSMEHVNPYANLTFGAIVEIIGYLIPSFFMICFGRKPILILFLVMTAVCLLITPYFSEHSHLGNLLIAQLGKFAISAAVCVTYIFVPELFPTSIRGTGMGFFVLLSRLGSAFAPIIDVSISHKRSSIKMIYYLYAMLTIVCVVLTLFLPETRNVPLVDKIEYKAKKPKSVESK